ncbi:MAG: hypothetical protein QNJ36_03150 [Calothrix sp. MO_167.B42]|nr:hypothetical protein [Calothrix sp. MO_167.B42]
MTKLQPKDYAAISVAAVELKQEIAASDNFKKIMQYGELPGYAADISLNIAINPEGTSSLDKISLNLPIIASDIPADEVEDEDDSPPY